jgi:hypothetical protein
MIPHSRFWMANPPVWGAALCLMLAGCGGDARVELSAAMAIDRLAGGLRTALEEYHQDVLAGDDRREDAVIGAFVERIRQDHEDEGVTGQHVTQFREALRRLREDRSVEWERYQASADNVATLVEVTEGLRRTATESITLSDEARRYVQYLIDLYRESRRSNPSSETDDAVSSRTARPVD